MDRSRGGKRVCDSDWDARHRVQDEREFVLIYYEFDGEGYRDGRYEGHNQGSLWRSAKRLKRDKLPRKIRALDHPMYRIYKKRRIVRCFCFRFMNFIQIG